MDSTHKSSEAINARSPCLLVMAKTIKQIVSNTQNVEYDDVDDDDKDNDENYDNYKQSCNLPSNTNINI